VDSESAQIARPPAGDPRVKCDSDALEVGGLGALHEARGELAVWRGVELKEPGGVAELRSDVLHRIGRQRPREEWDTGLGGGASAREVAVTVLGANADDPVRRHEDR
jgi:hypothetical protein